MEIKPIARFRSPFRGSLVFPSRLDWWRNWKDRLFLNPNIAIRISSEEWKVSIFSGLSGEFSANKHKANSPVVRPPVLGGNEKVGVFATRSPFRPNNIGLSSVKISHIEWETSKGPVIHVKGGDLMDGTPIYDIKPYVVYADCHPDARSGFVDDRKWTKLDVEISGEIREYLICQGLNDEKIEILKEVLAQDPRPHYQKDPHKVYGMPYEGLDIHFSVCEKTLTVVR